MTVERPENAEHELKLAYDALISALTTGQPAAEITDMYQHAYSQYQAGARLSAERWARTVKHLAKALWHEARIATLRQKKELIALPNAAKEYGLRRYSATPADILDSVPRQAALQKWRDRGEYHLRKSRTILDQTELEQIEHAKAVYEYSRVLECLLLAYEADKDVA